MFNFNLDATLLIQAFGLIFVTLGVTARLSYWKKWYWQIHNSSYGYIPYGCLFVIYSYNENLLDFFKPNQWLVYIIYGAFLAIGLWFSMRTPLFMKPLWVRWIEKYPKNIIDAMRIEAKDDTTWEKHIKDEAAVDVWAKMVKTSKGYKKASSASKG